MLKNKFEYCWSGSIIDTLHQYKQYKHLNRFYHVKKEKSWCVGHSLNHTFAILFMVFKFRIHYCLKSYRNLCCEFSGDVFEVFFRSDQYNTLYFILLFSSQGLNLCKTFFNQA